MFCAFTGHRYVPKWEESIIKQRLDSIIHSLQSEGIAEFYSGGAVGFDMMAAEQVLLLRAELGLRLCMAIPFSGQDAFYSPRDKARYARLLAEADDVFCANGSGNSAYFTRNRFMIDNASVCVAYLTKSSGGSAYTVRYAESKGLKVYNLAVQK